MGSEPVVDHRPLAERVRPSRLADVVGNREAVASLEAWAQGWTHSGTPRRRAALLVGVPGVGKTSAALALAEDMGWNLVELNASDARNQRAIEQVAGRASLSHSLSALGGRGARGQSRALILLDEADCLTGRAGEESRRRPAPITFREFLRGRYGSLDELAAAWGLGGRGAPPRFEQWERVPSTPGRGAWVALPSAQRDIRDWRGVGPLVDTSDRGGLPAIARLVRDTRQPVVLTVNDERPLSRYSPIFRTAVVRIRFRPLSEGDVRTALRRVALAEGYRIGAKTLDNIVRRSEGDLRGALNDLEAVASLPPGPAQEVAVSPRERTTEFAELTEDVITHARFYRSVEIRDRLDATPDDLFPWIEENTPRYALNGTSRWRGLEQLARAELMLARARRHRVFSLWSYASESMTGGVASALAGPRSGALRDAMFPTVLAEMGRTRVTRGIRTGVLAKVGRYHHLSRRKASEGVWDLLEIVFREGTKGRERTLLAPLQRGLASEYGLSREELGFLMGVAPESVTIDRLLPEDETLEPAQVPGDDPTANRSAERSSKEETPGEHRGEKRRQRRLAEY